MTGLINVLYGTNHDGGMETNYCMNNLKAHKLLCDYIKYEINLEDIGRSRLAKFEHIQGDKGPVQWGEAGALCRDPRPLCTDRHD